MRVLSKWWMIDRRTRLTPSYGGLVRRVAVGGPGCSLDAVNSAMSLAGLCKSFGAKVAVDHLDLQVPRGCLFGLVGPNGAGKTTTLSMATGLLRPDAGTAQVLDHDVWADPAAAKALMGVLPDGLRLFDRLSGGELLHYVGLLRRVPADQIASRSAELLEALGLTGRPRHPGRGVLGRHDQEDRPGLRAHPRAAVADLGRAVRGGRPGVRARASGRSCATTSAAAARW